MGKYLLAIFVTAMVADLLQLFLQVRNNALLMLCKYEVRLCGAGNSITTK